MTTSRHCRLANSVALIGAIFSAAVTINAADRATTSGDHIFVAMVVGWACTPYLATALLCYFIDHATWRHVMTYGLLGYAITDGYIRVQALYFPTGSTDSLIVLFLPVWSPAVVLIVGGVSAIVVSAIGRLRQPRP